MQWSSQLEFLLPFDISFEISEICCQTKHLNWMLIYEQEEKKKRYINSNGHVAEYDVEFHRFLRRNISKLFFRLAADSVRHSLGSVSVNMSLKSVSIPDGTTFQ